MLKGEKVILRAIERDDLKRLHELSHNVDLSTLAGGSWEPRSLAAVEKEFDKDLEDKDKHYFVIVVEEKVIGDIGLHHVDRLSNCTSFGIAILEPEYLGKGYGRDALGVLVEYAFRLQNFRRMWLETHGNNERAVRSYKACGFVEEGRLREHVFSDGAYIDTLLMGLLRSEWEMRRMRNAANATKSDLAGVGQQQIAFIAHD